MDGVSANASFTALNRLTSTSAFLLAGVPVG